MDGCWSTLSTTSSCRPNIMLGLFPSATTSTISSFLLTSKRARLYFGSLAHRGTRYPPLDRYFFVVSVSSPGSSSFSFSSNVTLFFSTLGCPELCSALAVLPCSPLLSSLSSSPCSSSSSSSPSLRRCPFSFLCFLCFFFFFFLSFFLCFFLRLSSSSSPSSRLSSSSSLLPSSSPWRLRFFVLPEASCEDLLIMLSFLFCCCCCCCCCCSFFSFSSPACLVAGLCSGCRPAFLG
mmetsp:Transcript_14711/g.35894  ORF Transcript_14711/g.35894 Transcript_14711/m.35894 type:complete len:235 (+) Transcript_14711:860-1564(+)